jgi:hypothetical protein
MLRPMRTRQPGSSEQDRAALAHMSRRVKYLVENGPLYCARVAGHLKEGPDADQHNQGIDDTEDRQPVPPHHQKSFRHRELRHRTWHQRGRPAVWPRPEDSPCLVSPLAGRWARRSRAALSPDPSTPGQISRPATCSSAPFGRRSRFPSRNCRLITAPNSHSPLPSRCNRRECGCTILNRAAPSRTAKSNAVIAWMRKNSGAARPSRVSRQPPGSTATIMSASPWS